MTTLDRQQVLDAIPSNWVDNLLTGPDAALPKSLVYSCPDIERLLNAIRKRIEALPTSDET